MGWRDYLEQIDLQKVQNVQEVRSGQEQNVHIVENVADSDSEKQGFHPELVGAGGPATSGPPILKFLTDAEREAFYELVEVMQSPRFGMDQEASEQEASRLVARYRLPLQIRQAIQDFKEQGFLRVFSGVLGREVYIARDGQRVPDKTIPVFTLKEIQQCKNLTPEEAKALLEAKLLFGGEIIPMTASV